MPTRRQFIAGTVTAGAAILGASVATADRYETQPDDVTIEGYGAVPGAIERYQPLLYLTDETVTPTQFSWRATSDEYEYDWYCYWAYYTAQQGTAESDSHIPDREPIYIGVADGQPEKAIFSDYHHAARIDTSPQVYNDTHWRYRVINPWHGVAETDQAGEFVGLRDLTEIYDDWLANGWGVDRRSVTDPPHVEQRGNWWPEENQRDHRLAVLWHNLGVPLSNPFRLDDWS